MLDSTHLIGIWYVMPCVHMKWENLLLFYQRNIALRAIVYFVSAITLLMEEEVSLGILMPFDVIWCTMPRIYEPE